MSATSKSYSNEINHTTASTTTPNFKVNQTETPDLDTFYIDEATATTNFEVNQTEKPDLDTFYIDEATSASSLLTIEDFGYFGFITIGLLIGFILLKTCCFPGFPRQTRKDRKQFSLIDEA